MEILVGVALVVAGLVLYAWIYARPQSVLVALVCAAVPTIVGRALLVEVGAGTGIWWWVSFAVWGAAFVLAHQTATVLRNVRATADGVFAPPAPVHAPHTELWNLTQEMRAAGFVLVPEGVVQVGANHLAVLVHDDGTRVEIIQGEGIPAGYACGTELDSGGPVVSVPWSHGIETDRIRVPGASLSELLVHHRAEVSRRLAGGATVRPIGPAGALAAVMASDQDEVTTVLAAPWRHSARMALQQSPLRRLVGA